MHRRPGAGGAAGGDRMKKGDMVWLTIPRKYVIRERKKRKGYWLCTLEPTIGTVKVYEDQLQGVE